MIQNLLQTKDLTTLCGDIYNALSDRQIAVKTMWYMHEKCIMKIPRRIPIRDGVLLIIFWRTTSCLEIKYQSVLGKLFGQLLLDKIDCHKFSDLESLVRYVSNKIHGYYHCRTSLKKLVSQRMCLSNTIEKT
jgi:hypothetical protein